MNIFKKVALAIVFCTLFLNGFSQIGFLKTQGTSIVNANGENVILRGAGLGGWMLQEGYMMQTGGFAGTQYQLKNKISELIGVEGMEEFYDAWLTNYCTKADVDSIASWGFNSIRLPMHYNLFTLPIEDEPVKGKDTWLNRGFEMVDNLLSWCAENEIYLILDLHAAPGGQGKNADISDYNPNKPSLWESDENKRKTIALWKNLAERYANEPWIGGYDLINEPNWDFENSGNQNGCNCNQNKPLWDLYQQTITAIRTVDPNHIIIVEGNCWGNNYNGLPKLKNWDNNLVVSFHKYWNHNNQASIGGMINQRNSQNVPFWLGESGENSNTWFANAINLVERNNIGWAWWPYKKIDSTSGNLSATKTQGYQKLLNYWGSGGTKPSEVQAKQWLLEQAEMLKIENCTINYDVNDAMFRQAQGDKKALPFKNHTVPGTIFASDYDLGANGFAYYDTDTADYHVSTDEYIAWNQGYAYRNDGVDIENCKDETTNGYNVGWTEKGEWMIYTINVDSTASYTFDFRYAANGAGGKFHLQCNEFPVSKVHSLPSTGGWANWNTYTIDQLVLEKGTHQLKLFIDNAGFNINYLKLHSPVSKSQINPEFINLRTDKTGNFIQVIGNIGFDQTNQLSVSDFEVKVNNVNSEIKTLNYDSNNENAILIELSNEVINADKVNLSLINKQLLSVYGNYFPHFTDSPVQNNAPVWVVLPAKIEAENFTFNNGFEIEVCTDKGEGHNLSYAAPKKYADYQIYVNEAGNYPIQYRLASQNSGSFETQLIHNNEQTTLHSVSASTGGWQSWQTISRNASLPEGKSTLRIFVLQGEFNLNWFQFDQKTAISNTLLSKENFSISQINNNKELLIISRGKQQESYQIKCFDIIGNQVFIENIDFNFQTSVKLKNTPKNQGLHIIVITNNNISEIHKIQVF